MAKLTFTEENDASKNDHENVTKTQKKTKKNKSSENKTTNTKKRKSFEGDEESSTHKKPKLVIEPVESKEHEGSQGELSTTEPSENMDKSADQQSKTKKGFKDWKKKWEKTSKKKKTKKKAEIPKEEPREAAFFLEYLTQWQSDRSAWRFNKHKQTWLLNHMYTSDQVPDESFNILLAYMEGSAGQARTMTSEKAQEIMKEADENEASEEDQDKVSVVKQERARQVLQRLSDIDT